MKRSSRSTINTLRYGATLCLCAWSLLLSGAIQAGSAAAPAGASPPGAEASTGPPVSTPEAPAAPTTQDTVPADAVAQLRALADTGSETKSISFSPGGGYVILAGKSGYWYEGIPDSARDKLKELSDAGSELKCIAFTKDNGWAILYDHGGYWQDNIPDDAAKKLAELSKAGSELTSISFTPENGWVILYDHGGYWQNNIPDDAVKKLADLHDARSDIKYIGFTPDGQWVVLWNRNGYWQSGVDATVASKLKDLASRDVEVKVREEGGGDDRSFSIQIHAGTDVRGSLIKGVSFAPGGGAIILAGKNRFWSSASEAPAPSDVAAVPASAHSINLTWSLTGDADTGILVLRAAGSASLTLVCVLPAHTTSYADTGLTAGTTYRYQVIALRGLVSAASKIVSSATPAGPR